jgi:hydroxymethylbilane synthase
MSKKLIIGSRGSDLALWQAHFVQAELKRIGITAEIKIIKTQGDQIQHLSFDKLEGKGFFTKELEDCLLNKSIDLAVHSHKDLPTTSPEGLMIAAVSHREDPAELLLIRKDSVDVKNKFNLKKGAVLGTSSARRKSQMLVFRDDIEIKELRGNVPTRIQKLRDKQYDAILLAAAGVERLNIDLEEFFVEKMNPEEFVPAPAQGVLALQIRSDDTELFKLLQPLHHADVAETIAVERRVLNQLDGGCQLPLGVYCIADSDIDGNPLFRTWTSFAKSWNEAPKWIYDEHPDTVGMADRILERLRSTSVHSAYITRNSTGRFDLLSKSLLANGITLHSQALIDIRPVPIKLLPQCDWIFFTSKNAVKHFFNQKPAVGKVKYGCVGKSTAEALRRFGMKPDFIGYSTDTRMTGKQFAATVGDGTVLFPQAKESMRSIQQQFVNSNKVVDLTVYETILYNDVAVPAADVYIFTSPSNVEAFFEKNKIKPGQKVVAMGGATGSALKQFGVHRFALPHTFDDIGIAQAVYSL